MGKTDVASFTPTQSDLPVTDDFPEHDSPARTQFGVGHPIALDRGKRLNDSMLGRPCRQTTSRDPSLGYIHPASESLQRAPAFPEPDLREVEMEKSMTPP